jgi:hypothetical protein
MKLNNDCIDMIYVIQIDKYHIINDEIKYWAYVFIYQQNKSPPVMILLCNNSMFFGYCASCYLKDALLRAFWIIAFHY